MRQVRFWSAWPPVGRVHFGDLRRQSPICSDWGFSRGTPIDRYYLEQFVARHADDIRGRVLEIGTNEMTQRYGENRVIQSDVLHVADTEPPVTIVADLTKCDEVPAGVFDCIIATQTLQFIYDVHAVVRSLRRMLKTGGVVLATVPGISKISPEDMERWGQFWCFTSRSARLVFEEAFASDDVSIEVSGNVLAATAFLNGIAAEELTESELNYVDKSFETLVGIRAQKPRA